MVSTTKILPSPFWQPYIKWFCLREFEASQSAPLVRPLPAMSESMLAFDLNGAPAYHIGHPADRARSNPVRKMNAVFWVTGVFDEFMGALSFAGRRRQFTIEFTASGFYNIFGSPASHFTSQAYTGYEVFGASMALLEEQLCEAKSLADMARISETFLTRHIKKQKEKASAAAIRFVSGLLENTPAAAPVETLAGLACMSLKSFERAFREQVGVTPKYFSRIIRFNKALKQKMMQPSQSWTSIAHANGYFDQMHFIKDFKQFAGMSPNAFLQHLPPPIEVLKSDA